MAKIKNCAFCGKEIKSGIFSGENFVLNIGGFNVLNCCEKCYNHYSKLYKAHEKRFDLKLGNVKKSRKSKLSGEEIAKMLETYISEADKYIENSKDKYVDSFNRFYCYNSNGEKYFSTKEFGKGFVNSDVSAKDMVKSMEAVALDSDIFFDKDDITKIEYAKVGIGDPLSLFSVAHTFNIRLNDESVMTYKPCITRAALLGRGFGFGYRRSAEKKLIKLLNEFKETIGSDLPIVKVKKI